MKALVRLCLFSCFLAFLTPLTSLAGSATWDSNPTSGDWNTAANWTPESIPSSETDVATFGASDLTDITCGDAPGGGGTSTIVGDIVFSKGAGPYTITITPVSDNIFPSLIEIHGNILNKSGMTQNFVTANSGTEQQSGRIYFMESGSAGDQVVITNQGGGSAEGDGIYGGFTQFWDSSSAGKATFVNNGSTVSAADGEGGSTDLLFSSNAKGATFINNPGTASGAAAASTWISTDGDIGKSTFIANPASVTGAEGDWTEWDSGTADGAQFIAKGSATAGPQAGQVYVYGGSGYATFTGRGGTGDGAQGGLIDLFALPDSVQTVVIAQPGSNGGLGGQILLEGRHPPVDQGQFRVLGNATLDLTPLESVETTIGSLAGDGAVSLDTHTLTIGDNNLTTSFSGIISGSGKLTKAGTGTIALDGVNTYTGLTTVSTGVLGGSGSVAGQLTVAANATLAPAAGTKKATTFTVGKSLTFQASSNYTCLLSGKGQNAVSDEVVADGVIINSGAQFNLLAKVQGKLKAGTSFTVLSDTASTPISGTFANLADGAVITVGNTKLQASYEGGDGNDLTLRVVP
jgi:autotransporter-associated beta strand protein